MNRYISTKGTNQGDGTKENPFLKIEQAVDFIKNLIEDKQVEDNNIHIYIEEGTYYLDKSLIFDELNSCTAGVPITYEGIGNVVISGGKPLSLNWKKQEDGIYKSKVEADVEIKQLFADDEKQILARYPSYQEDSLYYNGYAKDSFDQARVAHYKNPKGAFMHAMHQAGWGGFHYEVTGQEKDGTLLYVGGHQNNRLAPMHDNIRFIENVFEELTEEKEWYFDQENRELYYKPDQGKVIEDMTFIGVSLKNLITFSGTVENPVKNIVLKGITFKHAAPTFMEPMEPLLRSDWCIYRGGAIFLEGAENIQIIDCVLAEVGGNGIVVSGYNKNHRMEGCEIFDAGGSSVLFLGKTEAVREPMYWDNGGYLIEGDLDLTVGPKSEEYPRECVVVDNLLIRNGRIEKQSAAVSLSMCHKITIEHNTIYDVPRAGINICDGTWGGHVIAYNQVFDTVKETNDHGAFNSWGRDRFWDRNYETMENMLKENPKLPMIDAMDTTIMKNNIFECAHGWDIDLDDGSSNYEIYDNLCLRGGLKNREGMKRRVYNNIILNNTYHPHVWFANSDDEFYSNIVFETYADINLHSFGSNMNTNILYEEGNTRKAVELSEKSGMDQESIATNIKFKDMSQGDFTVDLTEDIIKMKFHNVDFSGTGVVSKKLKEKASSPFTQTYEIKSREFFDTTTYQLDEMEFKKLKGLGEISATGMYEERGIYLIHVSEESVWYERGLRSNDVVIAINGELIDTVEEFIEKCKILTSDFTLWRDQTKTSLVLMNK